MHKSLPLTLFLLLIVLIGFSQTKPATKKPVKTTSQKEVPDMMKEAQKMMDEAMKDMSPEEKKMMEEAMKSVKDMQAAGTLPVAGSEVKTKIPQKQAALLTSIPKIGSAEQYTSYLAGLKTKASKTIPQNIRNEVEAAISKLSSNIIALNNLPPSLFLQKKPTAAVYAAIRIAQTNKNGLLSQNNLAVILHQTGYPQYALPVLEYHLIQNKAAILYNNAAQCYLSLGEKKKAETYFMACLQIDPGHAEAHCGMALIRIEEGKMPAATPHIQQAMKNGYSVALDKLVETKNIKLDFDALKARTPEYFNPHKYKPVPAATKLSEVKSVLTQREELRLLMASWQEKEEKINEEQSEKVEKESLLQIGARIQGFFPTAPFGKKAKFMVLQSSKAMYDWVAQTSMDNYNNSNTANALHEELEKRIADRHKTEQFETAYEECKMQAEETNKYLQTSAEFYDGIIRKSVHKYYDFANQQLHWYRFLVNEEQYKTIFYAFATDLIEQLESYSKFQRLGRPDYVVIHCEKILQNPPKPQAVTEQPDANCPIKVKIPLGIGSIKMDCKGWEIEGGEVLVLGLQKDYKSGEVTFGLGLGANLELPGMGAGGKGQMFVKLDNDLSPVDCGVVLEAGGEATAGPVMIAEEKLTATIGMTSGINLTGVHAGNQVNIFEMNPGK